MDKDGVSIFAVGFDSHNETLEWLSGKINDGTLTTDEIKYKDNPFTLTGYAGLNTLYDELFGGSENVYFKDYVTNDTINPIPEVSTMPYGDLYIQTFSSLLNFLKAPHPKFLVIYKV